MTAAKVCAARDMGATTVADATPHCEAVGRRHSFKHKQLAEAAADHTGSPLLSTAVDDLERQEG
jgi:hypothetical protein